MKQEFNPPVSGQAEPGRSFALRLREAVMGKQNPTVMGLDPKLEYIPHFLLEGLKSRGLSPDERIEEALFDFNRRLIEAVEDIIPAIKPQIAYYEMYGEGGLRALGRTIRFAREMGLLVIADGKRNDIGSTSDAYASAWLGETDLSPAGLEKRAFFGADALTVNAYLGSDGIRPFLDACDRFGKGIFVLVRTSNPSAGELQDLVLADGRRVYEALADQVEAWNRAAATTGPFGPAGAVVGATWPGQAGELRSRMPHAYFLVPGYGAQGASADDCAMSFDRNGEGAIVNASRSLMLAWRRQEGRTEEEYAEACREEAIRMRDELNRALERHTAGSAG